MLSPNVRALHLRAATPFAYEPGQWINLYCEKPGQGEVLKRAYSIANAPGRDGVLELAVTRVENGALSPVLHALEQGAELEVDGPHGFFVRDARARQRPALFVGAGTGLAPLRAMIQSEVGAAANTLGLLFGCRTSQDVLWADEQARWQQQGVSVEVTLSRPEASWSGRTGYVQEHVAEMARALGEPDVYICGLTKMVKEVRQVLKSELGYDRKRIHSERYD